MFTKVKGFHDIYGADIEYWQILEKSLKETFSLYGFHEFKLPILEKTAIFNRGIGETTDIVEKEMFTFADEDETVSLRPEGTASLMRAYVENGLFNNPGIKKYYYMGNMFRRERPQKGRFRQFTQAGIEALESVSPLLDAEIITILYNCAKSVGIDDVVRMEINSVGCPVCRTAYKEKLIEYFSGYESELCPDCKRRLNKNPMRILDCKVEKCKKIVENAPKLISYLCEDCKNHLNQVMEYLKIMGTDFSVNENMVRGLDYYVRTAFEMTTDKLGSASAVGAGGRYDGLVKTLGGPDVPGIGFAIGMDRIVELMKLKNTVTEHTSDVFILFFNETGLKIGIDLIKSFRKSGLIVEYDYETASMKSQMKKANKSGAKVAVILGENELADSSAAVKWLMSGEQSVIKIDGLEAYIKEGLREFRDLKYEIF